MGCNKDIKIRVMHNFRGTLFNNDICYRQSSLTLIIVIFPTILNSMYPAYTSCLLMALSMDLLENSESIVGSIFIFNN